MKKNILLISILIIGTFLRLYNLSSFPSGLNADEAALGYNAFSLMSTGLDEHGHKWPINFESFGDFKPALYGYLLIPFVKILGLTSLAVRLPSALAGVVAIGVMYLLVRHFFSQKTALIAAVYLAVSPWHIHFSRGGWEVNLAATCILSGIYFIARWFKFSKFLYLALAEIFFVISMYTYQSARLLAPLLGVVLFGLYFKRFFVNKKQLILAMFFGLILLTPLLYTYIFANAASRISGVGLLSDVGPVNRVNELRGQYVNPDAALVKVLHNKPLSYTWAFIKGYADHFSGNFLFVNGDVIERNRVPETGLLYWSDALFILIGIAFLVRRGDKFSWYVLIWLFISPLASAFTFQTPHALRAQMMIYPLTVIIAVGIEGAIARINKKMLLITLVVVYCWQVSRYIHQYYVHYPQVYPAAWEYGFDQIVSFTKKHENDYNQILVTNKFDQPYILFLFYLKYPPEKFQFAHQLTKRDKFNFSTVNNFDRYVFTDTSWDKVKDQHGALIVAAAPDIPETKTDIIETITYPGGKPAFKIIAN